MAGAGLLQILRLLRAEVVELVHCRSVDVSGLRLRNWSAAGLETSEGSVAGAGQQILRLQRAEAEELVHCSSGDVSVLSGTDWSAADLETSAC